MKMSRLGKPLAIAGGFALLARLLACSSAPVDPAPAPSAEPVTPVPSGSVKADAAAKDSGTNEPSFADWVPWTDLSPTCQSYVSPSSESLPAPMRWEPCQAGPETSESERNPRTRRQPLRGSWRHRTEGPEG